MIHIVPEWARRWVTKAGFVQYVKSPYWLGGYEVRFGGGFDLDDDGLEWVRALLLRRADGLEFRIIDPEDIHEIVGPTITEEVVRQMYGKHIDYEDVAAAAERWRRHALES